MSTSEDYRWQRGMQQTSKSTGRNLKLPSEGFWTGLTALQEGLLLLKIENLLLLLSLTSLVEVECIQSIQSIQSTYCTTVLNPSKDDVIF